MAYTAPTPKEWHNDPNSGIAPTGTDTPLDSAGLGDLESRMIGGVQDAVDYVDDVHVNVKAFGAIGDGSTNDLTAINDAIASLGTLGGEVFFPRGNYAVSGPVVVPGGVMLRGTGIDYSQVTTAPARGSIVSARSGFSPSSGTVVQLSDDAVSTSSGKTGASMTHLVVDAAGRALSAVKTSGRRNFIRGCQIWRGSSYALEMYGQNGYLLDSILGLAANATVGGWTIRCSNNDNKIYRNQIREGGGPGGQLLLYDAIAVEVAHNHIFGGYGGTAPRHDISIQNNSTSVRIVDNTLEASIGHNVQWVVPAGVVTNGDLIVAANTIYQLSGYPAATYDVVCLDLSGAGSALRRVVVMGNTCVSSGGAWRSLVNKIGSGTLDNVALIGNQCGGIDNAGLMRNFRADTAIGNTTRYYNGSVTANYKTENGGRSLFNGTGAQTAFVIPHGLAAAPDHYNVTPGAVAAAAAFFVTADATNLTVTFTVAPASGTNNVVLNWKAFQ